MINFENQNYYKKKALTKNASNYRIDTLNKVHKYAYLDNSEFYRLKNNMLVEVIQNPGVKFLEKGNINLVIEDLRQVTLKAFGHAKDKAAVYTPDEVMKKNAIFVDFLAIVRKDEEIVAYTTASFVADNILYLNASMVSKPFQRYDGLGVLPHLYIWKKILVTKLYAEQRKLWIVGRTRNYNVVSMLKHVFERIMISTEEHLPEDIKKIFLQTARVTGSNYDPNTGIAKKVYPKGLPAGLDKVPDKYAKLFMVLGEQDALYVSGKVNFEKVLGILAKKFEKKTT